MKTQQFFPLRLLLSVVGAILVLLAITSWLAPIAVGEADGNSVSAGAPVQFAQGDSVSVLQETLTSEPEATPTPVPAATRVPVAIPPNLPPLVAALNHTTAAKTWRYSIQTILSDPYSSIELYKYDGEAQDENYHVLIGGALVRGQPIEAIAYGDSFYFVRDGAWVFIPKSKAGPADLNSKQMFMQNIGTFQQIADESVDGLACQVFTIDKEAGRRLVQSLGLPESWMSNVVNVEVTYWVCADGYVHRARTRVDMLRPDGSTNIGRVEGHFFDFGAPIVVTSPPDSKPAE